MPSENQSRLGDHYYVCPLAGLQMNIDQVFIGDLHLAKLSPLEWGELEKGYLHLEWHGTYHHINPTYVYHKFKEASNAEQEKAEIDSKITNLISALRLHKSGVIHDPIFTVRFVKQSMYTHREVGPYRDEYLTSIADELIYPLPKEEVGQVAGIYQSLTKLYSYENSTFISNVIDSFNLSFLPTLSFRFKLSIAYTALEMLYKVSPKIFQAETHQKSNLYQRAFATILAEYGVLDSSDPWYKFYSFSSEEVELEIHKIRKIVHHLKAYDAETTAEQALVFLQESLRLGIRLLSRLYHLQALNRYDQILDGLTPTLSPKELFNLALHRLFHGDKQLLEKILDS